jgi:hypothetical protein
MTCPDGATYQCSGGTILRVDNGVTLTSSGVQVYGRSTSDLAAGNSASTGASGLGLLPAGTTPGLAEVRVAKDATTVSAPRLLLSNLGLSWDGVKERPPIIETFATAQGRAQLAGTGAVSFGALPASTDLAFYNFASLGRNATQENYANNVYFPRVGNPSRCPAGTTDCPTTESLGPQFQAGDWRATGKNPDVLTASRLHEDGDIHAGNAPAGSNPPYLEGGSGIGVPYPGSKGFRDYTNWSYTYSNLSTWTSQDTVQMVEWTGGSGTAEHNKKRMGAVAFGNVTDPATVPTTGTASYSGVVYGWYSANGAGDPTVFIGDATLTVNFATRQINVAFANTGSYTATPTPVPVSFTSTVNLGAAGSNVAGYLNSAVTGASLTGGIGGRFFGPVVTTGTSGAGPAEIAGSLSMSNATGAVVLGGFIARKQ